MATRRIVDTAPLHTTARPLRRESVDGELLPALPEDVRPAQPAPLIRITLPRTDLANDSPVSAYETRKAQRAVTWESDVKVPFAQTVITAFLLAVGAGMLAIAFRWSWRVPVIVFGAALVLAWLWRLHLADSLLWAIETVTQHDVNNDGRVGRPAQTYTVANPHDARAQAQRAQRESEAEHNRAALVAFVKTCYTTGTSESAHGVKATGPDREAYVKARDVLLSLGVAKWRNPDRPRAGWFMAVTEAEALRIMTNHVL